MSDGLVAVYSLLNGLPVEGEAYLCSHTLNKTMFDLKDSDPRQRPYPVRSMVLVGSGSQVGMTAVQHQVRWCLQITANVASSPVMVL